MSDEHVRRLEAADGIIKLYVKDKRADRARIRELEVQVAAQKALLDECERIMTGVAYYSPEAEQMMANTLFKLRGKK